MPQDAYEGLNEDHETALESLQDLFEAGVSAVTLVAIRRIGTKEHEHASRAMDRQINELTSKLKEFYEDQAVHRAERGQGQLQSRGPWIYMIYHIVAYLAWQPYKQGHVGHVITTTALASLAAGV